MYIMFHNLRNTSSLKCTYYENVFNLVKLNSKMTLYYIYLFNYYSTSYILVELYYVNIINLFSFKRYVNDYDTIFGSQS